MAFFSAALGQAAITGVCVGLLIGEPLNAPYGGMFGFSLLSALAMVYAKRRSKLPNDTLIGVFLALTLGLGLCLLVAVTRQFNVHQVEAILFGSLLTVTDTDLVLLGAAALGVAVLLFRHYNDLLLDSLSPPLATARGINSAYLEYGFAIVLTIAILVSLKMIGALLVEALVIVPAAAARNIATGTRSYLVWSVIVAFVAGAGWVVHLDASARADRRRGRARGQPDFLRDARRRRASTVRLDNGYRPSASAIFPAASSAFPAAPLALRTARAGCCTRAAPAFRAVRDAARSRARDRRRARPSG